MAAGTILGHWSSAIGFQTPEAVIPLPGAIEVGAAGLRITCNHVQRPARIPIAGDSLHTLVEKVGKIDDLRIRESCLMCRSLASSRTDAVSKPVPQHDGGADEIRASVCTLRRASVTIDAVLRVDEPAAIGSGVIDALSFSRTCLRGE